MARSAVRIQVVEFGVLVGLALLVGRAAQVQILQGRRWAEEAQAQRTERIVLQARRGTLSDRHGTPLAVTQETYHVGIAPNELRDPVADGSLISRRLGLTAHAWQEALRRRYAYFAGPYSALEVQPLRSVRDVHLESVLNRVDPDPAVARVPARSPTHSSPGPWRRFSPPPPCSRSAACRLRTTCRGRGASGVCPVARSPTTIPSPRSRWPTPFASRATSPSRSSRRGSRPRSSM